MTLLRVNIPHSSKVPNPRCLIFDHTREFFAAVPITDNIMELMNHRFVIYVEGTLDMNTTIPLLHVDHEVEMTVEQEEEFLKTGISLSEMSKIYDE